MAYVAVDEDGTEIYAPFGNLFKPKYRNSWSAKESFGRIVPLPKGSIKKLIGKELTNEDEPVEIK